MGQQQLLIVILVMIIVGLATVVAITLFQGSEVRALQDEYTEIMLETAADIQVWWHKPAALGGGNHSFKGLDFTKIPCKLGSSVSKSNTQGVTGNIPGNCSSEDGNYRINLFSSEESVSMYCDINVGGEKYQAEYKIFPDRIELKEEWAKL